MLQAQWTEEGIGVFDVEPGPLADGAVRLRVSACGICGTDLHLYRRELPAPPGGVPGHEIVGTPIQGGDFADGLYAVEPIQRCGACALCAAGRPHLCPQGRLLGIALPGGLAELVDVPAYTLHPVDASVSPRVAALAEPLAVCVRAVNLAELTLSSRVLVLGGGTIGLLSALLARDRAAQVAITVRHAHQRALAESFGIRALGEDEVALWALDREPDVIIETVGGGADTLLQATRLCRRAGRVVVVGVFSGGQPIDALGLVLKELSLVGSNTYGNDRRGSEFRSAVDLLPRYRAELEALQTHTVPLREVDRGFAVAADKKSGAVKVVVTP